MSTTDLVAHEVQEMPEALQREVLDFIRFLKVQRMMQPAINMNPEIETQYIDLGQTALAQLWDTPEEDEAWKDL